MATKQQNMKAKKVMRSKAKAKERVKATQGNNWTNRKSAGGFNDKTKSVYDLINDIQTGATKIKAKKDLGEIPEMGVGRVDFLRAIRETLDQTIKMHGGIAVYMTLSKEGRFAVTPENTLRIETYERSLVRLVENVDAVILLDQANKLPEDYIELVIDVADVIRDLMVIHHTPTYEMLKRKQKEIDQYVTEHIPTGVNVFEYMRILHEERIKEVGPQYVTEGGVNAKEIAEMVLMTDDLISENAEGDEYLTDMDTDNLHPDNHPDVPAVTEEPQDPITEERMKDVQ